MSRKNRRKKVEANVINFSNYITEKSHQARPVARTPGQQKLLDLLTQYQYKIIVALGPAGTGKTYLTTVRAIERFQKGEIDKIVITRPATSVDEQHGFLPGDLNMKMEPWVKPIFDVLQKHFLPPQIEEFIHRGQIEIAPLAYMRGRTFDDAVIIGDEMQNSTPSQIKMLMTRLGKGSQMIITGDVRQSDRYESNGLIDFKRIYENWANPEYVKFVELTKNDVQRSAAVTEILSMYGD